MTFQDIRLPYVTDLPSHQLAEVNAEHSTLLKTARAVESPHFVVAVDFSQSNHVEWGTKKSPSLHAPGEITYNMRNYEIQTPYRRALELTTYAVTTFSAQPQFTVLGFADTIFYQQQHTYETVLGAYDELAAKFNNWAIRQSSGTDIALVVNKCAQMTVDLQKTIVLVLLTDGDICNSAKAIQAVSDASQFPLCIAVVGIGDGDFSRYLEFDDSLVERRFDNLSFYRFDYFTGVEFYNRKDYAPGAMANLNDGARGKGKITQKPANNIDAIAQKIFETYVFRELPQQFENILKMNYMEILSKLAPNVVPQKGSARSARVNAVGEE